MTTRATVGSAKRAVFTLAAALDVQGGAPLPTEFRIFKAGLNTTQNGYDVLFDEKAAKSILARAEKWGADLIIDLQHRSLLPITSPNYDADARGWFKLEVRRDANGGPELWATDVRWTPDGERRLREGTQRYPSPGFFLDDDNRVVEITNCGLVSMPGIDHMAPLAASRGLSMKKLSILSALTLATLASTLVAKGVEPKQIVKTLAAEDEGGDADTSPSTLKALAELWSITIDPADDPAGYVKAMIAKLDEVRSKLAGEEAPPPAEEMPMAEAAASREIQRLTASASLVESIAKVGEWRALALEDEKRRKAHAEEAKALEKTKRRALTARLVVAGAELPATAWEDDEKTVPAEHLRVMSLEKLEQRVLTYERAKGLAADEGSVGPAPAHRPATANRPATGSATLSKRDLALAEDMKLAPEQFGEIKARVDARRAAARAAREEG